MHCQAWVAGSHAHQVKLIMVLWVAGLGEGMMPVPVHVPMLGPLPHVNLDLQLGNRRGSEAGRRVH